MLAEDAVVGILETGNTVGLVDIGGVDLSQDALWEEDLTNVRDSAACNSGSGDGGTVVSSNVDMGCTALVPTWKVGGNLDDTVVVGLGKTTGEGEASGTLSSETGVLSGGVAMPKVHDDLWNNLAGCDIDDLNVKKEWDACLTLADIITDELRADIVWTNSDLWRQNTVDCSGRESVLTLVEIWVGGESQISLHFEMLIDVLRTPLETSLDVLTALQLSLAVLEKVDILLDGSSTSLEDSISGRSTMGGNEGGGAQEGGKELQESSHFDEEG